MLPKLCNTYNILLFAKCMLLSRWILFLTTETRYELDDNYNISFA